MTDRQSIFTNADPRFAGKLDDLQGGVTTMLMQQVREVMTVNQEMKDESCWIWHVIADGISVAVKICE